MNTPHCSASSSLIGRSPLWKMSALPNFRSRQLLDHARERACMMQVPDVCNGNPATVCAAHSNMQLHGKGVGIKSHDWAAAWACNACHDWLDRGPAPRCDKELAFYRGMSRTLAVLFSERLLAVL